MLLLLMLILLMPKARPYLLPCQGRLAVPQSHQQRQQQAQWKGQALAPMGWPPQGRTPLKRVLLDMSGAPGSAPVTPAKTSGPSDGGTTSAHGAATPGRNTPQKGTAAGVVQVTATGGSSPLKVLLKPISLLILISMTLSMNIY